MISHGPAVRARSFALTSALPAGFTFTRASAAQTFNASGALVSLATDAPAFDHVPSTGAPLGLRIESAATQLLSNVSAINAWSSFQTTATANDTGTLDPEGGTNADLIVETTSTSTRFRRQTITINPGQRFSASLFVKPNASAIAATRFMHFSIGRGTTTTRVFAYLNLATGAITSAAEVGAQTAGLSATATVMPNGWYFVELRGQPTGATDTTTTVAIEFATDTGSAARTYTGDGVSGCWFYGGNLWTGNSLQSPFASAATRAADVLSIDLPDGVWDFVFTTPSGVYFEREVEVSGGSWPFAWPVEAQDVYERHVSHIRVLPAPGADVLVDAENAAQIPFATFGLIDFEPTITATETLDPAAASGPTSLNTSWNTPAAGLKSIIDPAESGLQVRGGGLKINLSGSDRIIQGHVGYISGRGGGYWIGNDGTVLAQRTIIRDLVLAAGMDPIPNPATGASAYPSSDPPFAGEAEPAEGWGRSWADRDALTITNAVDLIIENCAFLYGVDEVLSMFRSRTESSGAVLRNILIRRCLIGPGLRFPKGPTATHGNVLVHPEAVAGDIHNKGAFTAYGEGDNVNTLSNVRYEACVLACNRERNPQIGMVAGATVDNNLIYGWGTTGITLLNPDAVGSIIVRTSMMARGNLFQPLDGYSELGAEIGVFADDGGSRFYTKDNYRLGATRAEDLKLPFGTVKRLNGATRKSMTRTIPFSTPYGYAPVDTEAERQALYDDILDYVGPRNRNGSGVALPGDDNTNPTVAAIIAGIRAGTLEPIDYPGPSAPAYDPTGVVGPGYLTA